MTTKIPDIKTNNTIPPKKTIYALVLLDKKVYLQKSVIMNNKIKIIIHIVILLLIGKKLYKFLNIHQIHILIVS